MRRYELRNKRASPAGGEPVPSLGFFVVITHVSRSSHSPPPNPPLIAFDFAPEAFHDGLDFILCVGLSTIVSLKEPCMPRLPTVIRESFRPDKQPIYDAIGETRGRVSGLFPVLLNSPEVTKSCAITRNWYVTDGSARPPFKQ
jgi:hypothetical protein